MVRALREFPSFVCMFLKCFVAASANVIKSINTQKLCWLASSLSPIVGADCWCPQGQSYSVTLSGTGFVDEVRWLRMSCQTESHLLRLCHYGPLYTTTVSIITAWANSQAKTRPIAGCCNIEPAPSDLTRSRHPTHSYHQNPCYL